MIISTSQYLQIVERVPTAFKDVLFTKFEGTRGPCLATVDGPMTDIQALEYCKEVRDHGIAKPVEEKKAGNKVFQAGEGAAVD